ncbi:MAG: archaellin/type IV pilin N-terminal domain-containing protein [Candidatus Micrarchaeota archaeon]
MTKAIAFKQTKKGAVGIGTLIIFIAMVLVAAIAAAVMISTSGILQQRAMTTGKESISQVSSNIVVVSITGYANSNRSNLDNISIAITAAAGANRLDIRYLIIRVTNTQNETYLSYSSTAIANNTFIATAIRDPSNLFTTSTPVIDGSSLVKLWFYCSNQTPQINLPPRMKLRIELIPEHGSTIIINTVMPSTYNANVVNVYP